MMNSSPVNLSAGQGARIKLHVYTSTVPVLLLRVVRFLASRSIPMEVGASFVKFPRGEATADDAAAGLKAMGFRVLTSMDQFEPDTDQTMANRSAALLEEENTPKGHVHGPGCGHDHHDDHDHQHDHQHEQKHDHKH
jgi:hypothetical protein